MKLFFSKQSNTFWYNFRPKNKNLYHKIYIRTFIDNFAKFFTYLHGIPNNPSQQKSYFLSISQQSIRSAIWQNVLFFRIKPFDLLVTKSPYAYQSIGCHYGKFVKIRLFKRPAHNDPRSFLFAIHIQPIFSLYPKICNVYQNAL